MEQKVGYIIQILMIKIDRGYRGIICGYFYIKDESLRDYKKVLNTL